MCVKSGGHPFMLAIVATIREMIAGQLAIDASQEDVSIKPKSIIQKAAHLVLLLQSRRSTEKQLC